VEHHVLVDVEELAKQAGAPVQAANMVLLGAAIPMLGIDHDKMIEGVKRIFARKGEAVVVTNIAAIEIGYHASNI
jgi:indolepyruvate ferredoxin oxidoreductase beta subunit